MARLTQGVLCLGISLLSLYVSLHLAEYFFASWNPRASLPKNGRHSGVTYTWGHLVRENSFEARGPEPVIPKPPNTLRVLSLGDSLTWGAGVSEEERYTDLAMSIVQKQQPDLNVEFVNLARSGNPLIKYREQLYRDGERLEPDLLTIGFCVNDTQPKGQNYTPERQAYINRNGDIIMFLARLRHHFPHIEKRARDTFLKWGIYRGIYPDWPEALDRTYNQDSQEWKDFIVALQDIKNWSDERNLPTPIFMNLTQGSSTVQPTYYTDPDPLLKMFMKWYDQAAAAAKAAGFIVLDPRDEFLKQLNGKVLGVNELDGHPSAAEHRIYAETLAPAVLSQLSE